MTLDTPPFASIADAEMLGYTVTQPGLMRASIRIRTYLRGAGYPTDPNPVSDALIDLTCAIAQRLASIPQALAEGQQQKQQTASGFQQGVTYGWDAWKAKSGLDTGELAQLKQIFPPIPRSIPLGSPVDLHRDEP
ncbi:MAG: hypothetical protein QM804_10310 [Propionicimonas sp.]